MYIDEFTQTKPGLWCCNKCNKNIIGSKKFIAHMSIYHNITVEERPEIQDENKVQQTVEAPVEQPQSNEITLRFEKPVEITINGKPYHGKEVKAPNIEIAAEIVRIAKQAYGYSIFRN